MAFRLPPPWDPGFALPQNVRDEGLERHAYVTKWAPNGTYDDPKVGSGGYVLPTYVKSEGYGQGVKTTAWSPSGSTPGVKIGYGLNQRPNVVAVPAAYKRYGDRAASLLLKRVQAVPPAARSHQMKAALDAIDPRIHPRAMKAMAAAQASGKTGIAAAHAGISHAISTTLLDQVIQTGKTGRAPRTGLMGLAGCVSCGSPSALGAVPLPKAVPLTTGIVKLLLPNAQTGPGGITAGTCDSSGTYIWDAGGFWRRKMVGESCGSISSDPSLGPTSRDHRNGAGGEGGVSITTGLLGGGKIVPTRLAPTIAPGTTKLVTVGPFTFPLVDKMNIHWSGLLPDDWRAAINQQLARDCSPCIESSMRDASTASSPFYQLRAFFGPEMPAKINHDFIGVNPGGSIPNVGAGVLSPSEQMLLKNAAAFARAPHQPIARTKRPDTGDEYGLYVTLEPRDASKRYDQATNPWNLRIQWKAVDVGVWSWVWEVLSTIVDWAGDVISAIGSLTCDILSNPAGQVGAVAAGAAAGGAGGAKAGAAGAAIGAQLCAQPPPSATVLPSSPLVPLAIAGGTLAAVFLLTKKKKRAP